MPELPEVETVRNTLKNLILHKRIRDIDVYFDKMVRNASIEEFKTALIGKELKDIRRYGKHLVFEYEDQLLISHLRMEGKYFIKPLDEPRTKHEHVIFYFTDGTSLRYQDTRKFGTFDLTTENELFISSPVSKIGYEPFDERLTVSYLQKKFEKKSIAIKSALLDQTIISGLGNIYVDEVLFLSRVHPETPTKTITKQKLKDIIKNSAFVLKKAIDLGGTTIRSYTDSLGVTGRFQNELFVHTKVGEPCEVCGTIITKIKVNGRGTYYCTKCQKKKTIKK